MGAQEPRWLLHLRWAGHDWYLASGPADARGCVPVGDDGTAYPHLETLAGVAWEESVNWVGGASGEAKAQVAFTLPVDVAALVEQGHDLYLAECELSQWEEGESYDACTPVLRGRLVADHVPFLGEPILGTIEEPAWLTGAIWPPAAAIIATATWATVPDDGTGGIIGQHYPFVFGKPGAFVDDAGSASNAPSTPTYPVDLTPGAEKLLICGAPVVATLVTVYSVADKSSALLPVVAMADGLGRVVSVVDVSSKGTAGDRTWTPGGAPPGTGLGLDPANPGTFFVTDWGEGGLPSATSTGAMGGLGELALYLLQQRLGTEEAARVDAASWAEAALFLDACQVAGYLDESADPWTLLQSQLLPLAPALYVLGGPRGLRAVVFRDTPAELCRSFTVGQELHRMAGARPGYGSGNGLTAYTVSFAPSLIGNGYGATARLDASTDSRAAAALTRWPGGREDAYEAPMIAERASAEWVAAENIRLRHLTERTDELWCPLALGRSFYLGERIQVTDAQAAYAQRLFWVTARKAVEGRMVLGLTAVG